MERTRRATGLYPCKHVDSPPKRKRAALGIRKRPAVVKWFEWRFVVLEYFVSNPKPAPLEHQLVLKNSPSDEKRDDEQDQEYPEQEFCYPGCRPGNAGETQKRSCQRDDQKEN